MLRLFLENRSPWRYPHFCAQSIHYRRLYAFNSESNLFDLPKTVDRVFSLECFVSTESSLFILHVYDTVLSAILTDDFSKKRLRMDHQNRILAAKCKKKHQRMIIEVGSRKFNLPPLKLGQFFSELGT